MEVANQEPAVAAAMDGAAAGAAAAAAPVVVDGAAMEVADQEPAAIIQAIERHVQRHTPSGVTAVVRTLSSHAFPYSMPAEPAFSSPLVDVR